MIRPAIHAQHALPLPQGGRDLSRLLSLEDTFETWLATGATEVGNTLHLREHALGAATLSSASLRLIYEIANRQIEVLPTREHVSARLRRPLHQRIVRHEATLSASETQSVLPQGVLVQKTVSLKMGGKLIVCSCVGDERLERQHVRDIASALALPRRASGRCTINPGRLDPVAVFGMAAGMISPFFPPQRQTRVDALVLVPWPPEWEDQQREVTVSLSLWESLLLPLVCLTSLVRCYAAASYPHIPLIELPGKPNPQAGTTSALLPRAPPAEFPLPVSEPARSASRSYRRPP